MVKEQRHLLGTDRERLPRWMLSGKHGVWDATIWAGSGEIRPHALFAWIYRRIFWKDT